MSSTRQDNRRTVQTYDDNVQTYADSTDFAPSPLVRDWILEILGHVDKRGTILELGCGPGRDANFIESQGYKIIRTDVSQGFIDYNLAHGHDANILNALTDEYGGPYSLVFADAVFLHFTKAELENVLDKVTAALMPNGILGFGVKHGAGSEWTNEKLGAPRFFQYWSEAELRELLKQRGFDVLDFRTQDSHRPGVVWHRVIARKSHHD